jgi:hypothetical protein
MKVKDAIFGPGGLTPIASMEKGEIIRSYPQRIPDNLFQRRPAMAMIRGTICTYRTKTRSSFIRFGKRSQKPAFCHRRRHQSRVFISTPKKMTVRDLVFKAGNVLESAYLDDGRNHIHRNR